MKEKKTIISNIELAKLIDALEPGELWSVLALSANAVKNKCPPEEVRTSLVGHLMFLQKKYGVHVINNSAPLSEQALDCAYVVITAMIILLKAFEEE